MLLVLGVAAELTRMAYHTFRSTTASTEIFRKQTLATDLLNRELRLCTKILSPSKRHGDISQPGGGDSPLVFRRYSPSLKAETVVSYRLDQGGETLIRESFEPGYDPNSPASQVLSAERSPRIVATEVEDFTFETINPNLHYGAYLVKFELQVKTGEGRSRVVSAVRVRSI